VVVAPTDAKDVQQALDALRQFGPICSVKLYRVPLSLIPPVPIIPCLDHEAMLHQQVAPHASAYVQERGSGDLHELAFTPAHRRIQVDTVSTLSECSPESHARLLSWLAATFPGWRVDVTHPSWWRGDRRVAAACRSQVSLRNVLLGTDMNAAEADIERLRVISALMEKQSRVASWAVRTITPLLLGAAGVITYQLLGLFTGWIGTGGVDTLRYLTVGGLGATFLYYGLKAVQLTEMSNRVWKRTAEYALILKERRSLEARRAGRGAPAG
jgi:hypothetical protein